MARIRTIKPEFWSDEKLSECSLSARLLFIGLISFADDDGRMELSITRLKLQIFPCGKVPVDRLHEMLGELSEHSLIQGYAVDGNQYLWIPKFLKHQKINRPSPSRLPKFLPEYAVSIHGALTDGRERNGREGNGRDPELLPTSPSNSPYQAQNSQNARRAPSTTKRGTRLPDDFSLTPERESYAKKLRLDPKRTLADFRDYWLALPDGPRARKLDWDATWQTWCRRSADKLPINRKTNFELTQERLSADE